VSGAPFRFLHAADLHLERPLDGLAEVPDHLRELLIDAPRRAAEQVFDAAIVEEVDFVVLAGDVIDVEHAEAGAIAFLLEQFARLDERGIAVYWAGGVVDPPRRWPASVALSRAVHVFADGSVEETAVEAIVHHRDKQPLAVLVGGNQAGRRIRPGDYGHEWDELCSIAVAHGKLEAEAVIASPIDYWALGGQHDRASLATTSCTAIYAGTPQGRDAAETGPRGCTLVRVDEEGQFHPRFLPTDVMRWHTEHLHIAPETTRDALEQELRSRAKSLIDSAGQRALLISWRIGGSGPLLTKLRRGTLAEELADTLRAEYGFSAAPSLNVLAWTVAVETSPVANVAEEHYEEDTILGDFLRTLRHCRIHEAASLDVDASLPADVRPELAAAMALDQQEQQQVFDEAATLALDLLRGTEELAS
jgi:DNA repair exonuclease SbcCD nuclease subunit